MSEWTKGPYREEFGAIYHADERGYLFTTDPPRVASALADSLNELHRLKNAAPALADALEEMIRQEEEYGEGTVHPAVLADAKAALSLVKGEDRNG